MGNSNKTTTQYYKDSNSLYIYKEKAQLKADTIVLETRLADFNICMVEQICENNLKIFISSE